MLLDEMLLKNNIGLILGNIRLAKAMTLIKTIICSLFVLVIAIDYYTKWPEAAPMIDKTAASVESSCIP